MPHHPPFDPKRYIHHLEGLDINEAEKIEFVRTLWLIAQSFVDDAYSGKSDGTGCNTDRLKTGFEAANVIDLGTLRKTRAARNDNTASRTGKGQKTRKKRA
ncbi:hypothetical protein [Xanthobacter versatilis]|uniref:hypothetical protein n=1 Tax=Xanthobacter autotrophicus (strain ATCC BAA-1158 / Py2) TaxID=78245 RepID=UPI00372B43ED